MSVLQFKRKSAAIRRHIKDNYKTMSIADLDSKLILLERYNQLIKLNDVENYRFEEVMVSRGMAVATWSYEDVLNQAKNMSIDCSKAEAKDIIHGLHHGHDCNYGITWDHLDNSLYDLERERKNVPA